MLLLTLARMNMTWPDDIWLQFHLLARVTISLAEDCAARVHRLLTCSNKMRLFLSLTGLFWNNTWRYLQDFLPRKFGRPSSPFFITSSYVKYALWCQEHDDGYDDDQRSHLWWWCTGGWTMSYLELTTHVLLHCLNSRVTCARGWTRRMIGKMFDECACVHLYTSLCAGVSVYARIHMS